MEIKYDAFNSGKDAWRIGVHLNDNPFKQEPNRSQWFKGWHIKNTEWNKNRKPKKYVRFRTKTR